MSVLSPPRHAYVERALELAKTWCRGHQIDDAPALRHAALVAWTLGAHVPFVAPKLVAAALLHDAELFAPNGINLDLVLDTDVAPGVAPIVRAIAREHEEMDRGELPTLPDADVILVSAADKVVAFQSLRRRARRSGDEGAFWHQRSKLRGLLPYFATWIELADPKIPTSLSRALNYEFEALRDCIHGVPRAWP